MPLYPSTPSLTGTPIGSMGLIATTPAGVTSGFSWTYNTQDKSFPAYTPNVQSTAYTGGLLDLTQALRLPDGNNLRVAVENLRAFTEALAKQHNAMSAALVAAGVIATP